jgi:hypothetical protein
MNQSLFNIAQEYKELMLEIEMAEGEITPEIAERLDAVSSSIEVKAQNYGFIMKAYDTNNDIIDAEIERLKILKARNTRNVDTLKQRLKGAMEDMGVQKITTPLITASFRKSESVEIEDEKLIPMEYKVRKEEWKVDKVKIKEAIKSGAVVLGASISENNNLQIK